MGGLYLFAPLEGVAQKFTVFRKSLSCTIFWGGIFSVAVFFLGLYFAVSTSNYMNLVYFGVLAVLTFTLVSCLVLDNNFIGIMILTIWSWGFIKMPMLIFTLDLDGILWLLTVKLLFWILELAVSIFVSIFAIALGMLLSVFVYPFALQKSNA